MKRLALFPVVLALFSGGFSPAAEPDHPLKGARRIVFLGDSITYAGGYIEYLEAYMKAAHPGMTTEFLDIGLPSETVSGLSEPGHAGGSFPRPDLHERLDRVLAKAKPDMVVVCYGMNDGIYYPFSEERFKTFRDGMTSVHDRIVATGARVLHLTPPVFDPTPIKAKTLPAGLDEYRSPYVGYDDVLARYAQWLLAQSKEAKWDVIDIHEPIKAHLAKERTRDPAYIVAGDGVHINQAGHWLIAKTILRHWEPAAKAVLDAENGDQAIALLPEGSETLKLIRQRQAMLKNAWLTATGHVRPGMAKGIPLPEAEMKAAAIEAKLPKPKP